MFFLASKSAQPLSRVFPGIGNTKNGDKNSLISVTFLALASLVEHRCAKTGSFLKDLTQIFQMALQYPRDLVGSLMNLKNSKIFES